MASDRRASARASSLSMSSWAVAESLSSAKRRRRGESISVSASESRIPVEFCQSFMVLARVSSENRNAVRSTYDSRSNPASRRWRGAISSREIRAIEVSSDRNSAATAGCFLRSHRVGRRRVSGSADRVPSARSQEGCRAYGR